MKVSGAAKDGLVKDGIAKGSIAKDELADIGAVSDNCGARDRVALAAIDT